MTGTMLSVRLVRKIGATTIANLSVVTFGAMLFVWSFGSRWVIAIFVMQFIARSASLAFRLSNSRSSSASLLP